MALRIIITAPAHPFLMETLTQHGYEVMYEPAISYDALSKIIDTATGLIVTTRLKIDQFMINGATQLKWIGRIGSGMELIDTEFAASKNIQCVSSPEGNCTTVGEHALGLLLSLMNRIHSSYAEIQNGQWIRDANRADELTGKTVGIIGFGNTGGAFAKVLSGFNVKILAHDIYKTNFDTAQIKQASLQEIQEQANVISLHLPLTELTQHYANDSFFNACVQKPYFLSTCRGAVTNTDALLKALQNQLVSGVGIDVLENEQLDSYSSSEQARLQAFMAYPNFILTPHIAGYSHEAYLKMSQILLGKLGII
ncbi:MAG: hydroxyacid dehydrogenase [Sediminibacterium sp.]|jgi:D-3-phosphoglycerate dehydrogenase|nr:hydroxyacid dehydrogenase [Sediminibacterium sp.]